MMYLECSADEQVCHVLIDANTRNVAKMDGRTISVRFAWFPRVCWKPRWRRALTGSRLEWQSASDGIASTRN